MIITEETLLLQKRAGIITEAEYKEKIKELEVEEQLSDDEIEKQFLEKMKTALSQGELLINLSSPVELDPKIKDKVEKAIKESGQLNEEQLNELLDPITISGLIIGAPGLVKLLKWIAQGVGWLMGLNKGDGNMFSRALEKAEHWLHDKYIKLIIKGLRKMYPVYQGETDENMEILANKIYLGMLTAALVTSGVSVAKAAHGVVAAAGEAIHGGVTATDIASIASKIADKV